MAKTLYFYNSELEQCIKVTGVIAEPTDETKTVKGKVYRLNWRTSTRSSTLKMLGSISGGSDFVSADVIAGGVVPVQDGGPTANYNGSILGLTTSYKLAVPDDIAGRAGRQDDVVVPYWKMRVSTGEVPDYVWISKWDYPSYGNAAPSWDPAY